MFIKDWQVHVPLIYVKPQQQKKVIKVGRGNSKPLETTRDILEELENEERQ